MECLNCNFSLNSSSVFCSRCGAKVIQKRLSFGDYFKEFSNNYLRVDNILFKTIKTLFLNPKLVVNGYIRGVRKKYVDPFRFLLTTLFFAGIYVFLLKKGYLGVIDYGVFESSQTTTSVSQKEFLNWWMDTVFDYNNLWLFLTIPFLAIISKIVFYNYKQYKLVEHFIIYTYTYSFCSLIGYFVFASNYFFQFNVLTLSNINFLLYLVYHIVALKNIFSLNLKQILLKTFLFLFVFAVFFILVILDISLIFVAYLAATGNLPQNL